MDEENIVYKIVPNNERVQTNGGPPPQPEPPKGFGSRHTQVLVLFICLTVGYTLKANLSVSMVAMTNHMDIKCVNNTHNDTQLVCHCNDRNKEVVFETIKRKAEEKTSNGNDTYQNGDERYSVNDTELKSCKCGDLDNGKASKTGNRTEEYETSGGDDLNMNDNERDCGRPLSKWSVYRKYDWNKSTQEMIVFSFFLGYTSMQLPMGYLAQKFGGKKPILVALAVNGGLSLVTPWLPIMGGWLALCGCRLVQGMTQAAFYPSIHTLLARWAPVSERGRLSTYVYTGSQFGTIVIFQISGLFAGSPAFGWPATFWFCGLLSLLSFCLLAWLGAASPHEHPSISTEEMTFILEGANADVVPKKRRVPWRHILTSKPVLGLVAAHAGSAAGYLLVLTQIPTYMNYVLGVEIKKNGVLSSLPYIAMYLTALSFGVAADFAANKKMLKIANIRRIANTIGLVVSGAFLIGFSFVSSTVPAVTMLILTMALHSAVHVGFHINQIDLAPNFAGPIMALGNMMANLISLLVPVIVSNIVQDDMANQRRWQIVFLIFAGLQFVTNTVFVVFVKGKVQPWNFYGEHGNEIEKADAMVAQHLNEYKKQEKLARKLDQNVKYNN